MISFFLRSALASSRLQRELRTHFKGIAVTDIVTAGRDFPITSRVDVQAAIEDVVPRGEEARLLGIHAPMNHETPTIAHLLAPGPFPVEVGPLQHDEIDIGDETPVRCCGAACRWRLESRSRALASP